MAKKSSTQLKGALQSKQYVRFKRRFEDSSIHGYVLDIGPKFFLLALVSDRIWFDGFECFRLSDVNGLVAPHNTNFVESALRKRRDSMPKKPRVGLGSIEELLLTAGRVFPLVTIHREQVDPDVCWIGRILGVKKGRVSMLQINSHAEWHDKPSTYLLREITRVNFGGDYEDALHLVGGNPNKQK
ncbi:MAG: hypothetical protein WCD79_20230 [Chthoniobacteraceae bacterium]